MPLLCHHDQRLATVRAGGATAGGQETLITYKYWGHPFYNPLAAAAKYHDTCNPCKRTKKHLKTTKKELQHQTHFAARLTVSLVTVMMVLVTVDELGS